MAEPAPSQPTSDSPSSRSSATAHSTRIVKFLSLRSSSVGLVDSNQSDLSEKLVSLTPVEAVQIFRQERDSDRRSRLQAVGKVMFGTLSIGVMGWTLTLVVWFTIGLNLFIVNLPIVSLLASIAIIIGSCIHENDFNIHKEFIRQARLRLIMWPVFCLWSLTRVLDAVFFLSRFHEAVHSFLTGVLAVSGSVQAGISLYGCFRATCPLQTSLFTGHAVLQSTNEIIAQYLFSISAEFVCDRRSRGPEIVVLGVLSVLGFVLYGCGQSRRWKRSAGVHGASPQHLMWKSWYLFLLVCSIVNCCTGARMVTSSPEWSCKFSTTVQHLCTGVANFIPLLVGVYIPKEIVFMFVARRFDRDPNRMKRDGAFMASLLDSIVARPGDKMWVHHGLDDDRYDKFDPRRDWYEGVVIAVTDDEIIVHTQAAARCPSPNSPATTEIDKMTALSNARSNASSSAAPSNASSSVAVLYLSTSNTTDASGRSNAGLNLAAALASRGDSASSNVSNPAPRASASSNLSGAIVREVTPDSRASASRDLSFIGRSSQTADSVNPTTPASIFSGSRDLSFTARGTNSNEGSSSPIVRPLRSSHPIVASKKLPGVDETYSVEDFSGGSPRPPSEVSNGMAVGSPFFGGSFSLSNKIRRSTPTNATANSATSSKSSNVSGKTKQTVATKDLPHLQMEPSAGSANSTEFGWTAGLNLRSRFALAFRSRGKKFDIHRLALPSSGQTLEEILGNAQKKLRCVEWQNMYPELMASSSSEADKAANISRPVRPGERIDYFLSHSWYDDAELKWQCLTKVAEDFHKRHRRYPTLWIDKVCIDQSELADGLKALSVVVMACQNILMCCGSTYVERLWCVWEVYTLFCFAREEHALKRLTIREFGDFHIDQLTRFDVRTARCYDPNERLRLMKIIEAGDIDVFNEKIRRLAAIIEKRDGTGTASSSTFPKSSFELLRIPFATSSGTLRKKVRFRASDDRSVTSTLSPTTSPSQSRDSMSPRSLRAPRVATPKARSFGEASEEFETCSDASPREFAESDASKWHSSITSLPEELGVEANPTAGHSADSLFGLELDSCLNLESAAIDISDCGKENSIGNYDISL